MLELSDMQLLPLENRTCHFKRDTNNNVIIDVVEGLDTAQNRSLGVMQNAFFFQSYFSFINNPGNVLIAAALSLLKTFLRVGHRHSTTVFNQRI